jgi:hypothetical protein
VPGTTQATRPMRKAPSSSSNSSSSGGGSTQTRLSSLEAGAPRMQARGRGRRCGLWMWI